MLSARRITPVLGATAALAVAGSALASGASAATAPGASKASSTPDSSWNLRYDTTASTYIKKMNQTTTTTGTTYSTYTFGKGSLSSDLTLNDFKSPVKLGNLTVAYATISQEPTGKATGKIDPATGQVTQSQQAYLHIKDISLTGHGLINFVGSQCRTVKPVTMNVSGPMKGGFDPIHLHGTFDIGQFQNCGVSTSLVNQQVPGSGNTIDLTLTPRG